VGTSIVDFALVSVTVHIFKGPQVFLCVGNAQLLIWIEAQGSATIYFSFTGRALAARTIEIARLDV
jgi:hypothetical protein